MWRASGRSVAKVAAGDPARRCSIAGVQSERESKSSRSDLKPGRSVAELEAEIRRLRAENAKLLEPREVLKKSLFLGRGLLPRGSYSFGAG